jgi:hypothetical protein
MAGKLRIRKRGHYWVLLVDRFGVDAFNTKLEAYGEKVALQGKRREHEAEERHDRVPSPTVRKYCEQRGFSRFVCNGGFDYLLRCWERIVAHVDEGYQGSIDEYLNDMDVRRIINELLPLASDEEQDKVERVGPSLDGRFLKATCPVDSCIWGQENAAKYDYRRDRDWWYYRIPINLGRVSDQDKWPQ